MPFSVAGSRLIPDYQHAAFSWSAWHRYRIKPCLRFWVADRGCPSLLLFRRLRPAGKEEQVRQTRPILSRHWVGLAFGHFSGLFKVWL